MCRCLLDDSRNPSAHFFASAVIKDAVVREWPMLAPDIILGLKVYIMELLTCDREYVVHCNCNSLTRSQVPAACAS